MSLVEKRLRAPGFVTALVAAFAVVSLGFVGSTAVELATTDSTDATRAVYEATLPSVRDLAAARTHARRLERAHETLDFRELDLHRARLESSLREYETAPASPAEKEIADEARRTLDEIDFAVESTRAPMTGVRGAAPVGALVTRFDEQLAALADINLATSERLVDLTTSARASAIRTAIVADAVALMLSIAAAAIVIQTFRRQRALEESHQRLLARRADELGHFAGRVAHDVVSPLSTASLVLQRVLRKGGAEDVRFELVRGLRALQRADAIVKGLLDFATAGAQPQAGARASMRLVVDGVVEEALARNPNADFELEVDHVPDRDVACAPGVLGSVVSNLVTNAIKHTADAPTRRIVVRARHLAGNRIRCEVADTGPGIPEGAREMVFLPHVRLDDTRSEGLGIGLATVKALVEAHGGAIGVESEVGRGSVFWFELPEAPPEEVRS